MAMDIGKLVLLGLLAILAVSVVAPDIVQQYFGGVTTTTSQTYTYAQGEGQAAAAAQTTVTTAAKPMYPVKVVTMELKDAFNPKAGIPNVTVEVIPISGTESKEQLKVIASSPMRRKVDEAVSDADGVVTFDGGRIFTEKPYLYSIRGDTDVYDKMVVYAIPAPEGIFAPIDSYPVEEPVYLYRVGSWYDISDDADNIINVSVTGLTGMQLIEVPITIGEAEAGAVLKNPVLYFKSPEGKELEVGDIVSIYVMKDSGNDLIPPEVATQNLVDWIDVAPIALGGSLTDEEGNVYMTMQDKAQYTLKIQFDADQIEPGYDSLQIVLDDLGAYRGTDDTTRGTKADPMILTINFVA